MTSALVSIGQSSSICGLIDFTQTARILYLITEFRCYISSENRSSKHLGRHTVILQINYYSPFSTRPPWLHTCSFQTNVLILRYIHTARDAKLSLHYEPHIVLACQGKAYMYVATTNRNVSLDQGISCEN